MSEKNLGLIWSKYNTNIGRHKGAIQCYFKPEYNKYL